MQRIVAQIGALAGVGVTVMLAKKMFRPKIHVLVHAHPKIVSREPAIAEVLSNLALVGDEYRLNKILDVLDEVIRLASVQKKSNQWHISRLNGEIIRQAKEMCKISSSVDDATFQGIMFANDEYIPQLETLLDNMLHNYLLDQ